MDTKPSDEAVAQAALDSLLQVVAKSADDLRNFHEALTRLRTERKAPFPRVVVATANNIVELLTKVEELLKRVTVVTD